MMRILSHAAEENSAFSSELWENHSLRSDLVNNYMLNGPRLGDVEDIATGVSRLCEILQVLGEDFDHSDGNRLDGHTRVVNVWTKLLSKLRSVCTRANITPALTKPAVLHRLQDLDQTLHEDESGTLTAEK